jgi:hypothetical protein
METKLAGNQLSDSAFTGCGWAIDGDDGNLIRMHAAVLL